jgi:hypothetical protein
MTDFTKLSYNSSEERIEAVAGNDYKNAVVVYSPFSAPVDPETRKYTQPKAERRADAARAMHEFVKANPSIVEGSDGQVFRVDYTEVVLPVAEFIELWLSWYFDGLDGARYIQPGHPLWETTADGAPMRFMDGKPYALDDSIREGGYVPTPAYYGQLTIEQEAAGILA